jgi:hypothetical protein
MTCTERLCLRLLQPGDAVQLSEVAGPGRADGLVAQDGDRLPSPWAIVLRDGGALVGFCGFFVRPDNSVGRGCSFVPRGRVSGVGRMLGP